MAGRTRSDRSKDRRAVHGPNVELPGGTAAERAEAWERTLEIMRHPPPVGPGACAPGDYGSRDDWYEDRPL